jgi:hypothetical protein
LEDGENEQLDISNRAHREAAVLHLSLPCRACAMSEFLQPAKLPFEYCCRTWDAHTDCGVTRRDNPRT